MSTHDTDPDVDHEVEHADENYGVDSEGDEVAQEQAYEAQEAEPVDGDMEPDATDETHAGGETDTDLDTEGLADPDADVDGEADAIALGPVEGDDPGDSGVGGVVTAEQWGGVEESEEADELAAEPVVVDLDETDVEVLDDSTEVVDDDADEDDDSVLLTESEPGSVLPPEEPDEPEEPEEHDEPEPRAAALLEPVDADAALDPGAGTYQERWSAIQGAFVDEPARAVESAGALVAQMWHDFERSMTERREALDGGWSDDSPTDDLRDAFKRYRTMFTQLTGLLDDQAPR